MDIWLGLFRCRCTDYSKLAGLLAFPELLSAYRMKAQKIKLTNGIIWGQLIEGVKDTWRWKWDGLRGGPIGGFVGLVPDRW